MRLGPALLPLTLAACIVSAPSRPIPKEAQRSVGCARIGLFVDKRARDSRTSVVAEVHLENLCAESVPLDLSAMRITAYGNAQEERRAVIYDPRGEIVPKHMEAFVRAVERLRIDGVGSPETLDSICFDIAPALADETQVPVVEPICFRGAL
jgi:hypothetical protein